MRAKAQPPMPSPSQPIEVHRPSPPRRWTKAAPLGLAAWFAALLVLAQPLAAGPAEGPGPADPSSPGGPGSAAVDSDQAARAAGPVQLSLPDRPFGVDLQTHQAFTDGFFDVTIGPQMIGLYLVNQGSAPLLHATVEVSLPVGSGIVLWNPVAQFDHLPPGVPVLALFPADFASSFPGRHTLTVHVVADGFEGTVARDLFVVRSEHDPVNVNRWTMYADVGHITTEALSAYGGGNLGSLGVLTSFRQTVEYDVPFPGQFGPLPFQGPGDPWWKAFGLGFGLGGCVGWIAGEIVKACGEKEVGDALVGVGQAEKGAGGLAIAADVKDFFKRGQQNTLPGPGEVTVREEVQAQAQFLDEPVVGAPFRAAVTWSYQRTTRDALAQPHVYPYAAVETVTNLHFTSSRLVSVNTGVLRAGDSLVVSARLFGPEPLQADRAYVVATLYAAGDDGLTNLIAAVVLRDDGLLGDEVASDGLYTGLTPAASLPTGVLLAGYVFGYDVNNAAEGDPLAAQEIGGVLIAPPTFAACTLQPDFYVTVEPGQPPGLWFAGLQHTPLGQATLTMEGSHLGVANLGLTGQDGVSVALGDPEGHTTVLPVDPAALPLSAAVAWELRGPGDEPRAGLVMSRTANGLELAPDFTPIGSASYTARIYDGSRLVAVQGNLAGPQLAMQFADALDLKCRSVWWPSWKWGWSLAPTAGPARTPVRVPFVLLANGQTVEGTAVELVPDVLPELPFAGWRAAIRAMNLPEFRIADETLQISGLAHRALGQARLEALNPQHLKLANLGASGQDGVSVEELPAHMVNWEGHLQGLGLANDPANPVTDGAWLELTARGTVNSLPDQIVSTVHHQDVGDRVQTQVELGPVAPGPLSAVYRLGDGTTLAETNLPPGLWQTVSWPQKVSVSWRWWPLPPAIIDVDWGWLAPWAVVTPGGLDILAQAVEVQAAPGLAFDGYSSLALTASGVPEFDLLGEAWAVRPPNLMLQTPVLDRANGLFQFTVPTLAGFLYRVESTPSLVPPVHWSPRLTFSGDGGPMTVAVPTAPGGGEFFQLLATSSLAPVAVGCGTTTIPYENLTQQAMTVTIEVTDDCEHLASEVQVVDEKDRPVQTVSIPDGETKAVSFSVPPRGGIQIICNGDRGRCSYTILSAN